MPEQVLPGFVATPVHQGEQKNALLHHDFQPYTVYPLEYRHVSALGIQVQEILSQDQPV
jgi:hypothetical protein